MTKLVNLTIDGKTVSVPPGTLIVDAAKKVGVDVPVFCYHPKMEPVGMCRMCLVEIGRPLIDRATGQPFLEDDGSPKIQFGPKLETACTTPVSEGMVVLGASEKAAEGRKAVLEFLLTSHPLDCPICDKGGECPLQNLTMDFGPGESRYLYSEKKHLDKHVPLGDLIYLDRERCIQCGRCVRFQTEIVDDPVIGFFQRGRSLEIITNSDPGFDSYWSGNTSDICPVGALTTADFRFRARPWELRAAASICTHCPVGCNLSLNVRREAASGGNWVVKRVMPRQHEGVNEIWICDKGRLGYRYADRSAQRLSQPLVRRGGELAPASWEEALDLVAEKFRQAGKELLTVAGGRLSNEDLFYLGEFTAQAGGQKALYTHMAGGELTMQVGLAPGSNLADLAKGDVVLVVASDLEEEAPVWWLRLKQAADRGVQIILLNPRPTRLERYAAWTLRYPFGQAAGAVQALLNALSPKRLDLPGAAGAAASLQNLASLQSLARSPEWKSAAAAFSEARNAIVFYGSDGMGQAESAALARACTNLLVATGHTGRPDNGLVGVWPRANDQGAWELGWKPRSDLKDALVAAKAVYIAAADPVGDNADYQDVFGDAFVVVQDLFLTNTARLADVVLPAQAWTEREGSFTSGERRVQRFYPAVQPTLGLPAKAEGPGVNRAELLTAVRPALDGPQADYAITAHLGLRLGMQLSTSSAALAFLHLAKKVKAFAEMTYQKLAEVQEQWPVVGRSDLYYGGTTYENTQGLGVQLPLTGGAPALVPLTGMDDVRLPVLGFIAFPVTRLYDLGTTLTPSTLLAERTGGAYVVLSSADAERMKVPSGAVVRFTLGGTHSVVLPVRLDDRLPERVVLMPRSFGIPIDGPTPVEIKLAVTA